MKVRAGVRYGYLGACDEQCWDRAIRIGRCGVRPPIEAALNANRPARGRCREKPIVVFVGAVSAFGMSRPGAGRSVAHGAVGEHLSTVSAEHRPLERPLRRRWLIRCWRSTAAMGTRRLPERLFGETKLRDLGSGTGDVDRPRSQIDVFPVECDQFAAAQSRVERGGPNGPLLDRQRDDQRGRFLPRGDPLPNLREEGVSVRRNPARHAGFGLCTDGGGGI